MSSQTLCTRRIGPVPQSSLDLKIENIKDSINTSVFAGVFEAKCRSITDILSKLPAYCLQDIFIALQRSGRKVMFSQASVIHSVHRGGWVSLVSCVFSGGRVLSRYIVSCFLPVQSRKIKDTVALIFISLLRLLFLSWKLFLFYTNVLGKVF